MRKNDVDNIAKILYTEKWNGKSLRELKEYCDNWNKTDIYGIDLSKLTYGQIERVFSRYRYLYL